MTSIAPGPAPAVNRDDITKSFYDSTHSPADTHRAQRRDFASAGPTVNQDDSKSSRDHTHTSADIHEPIPLSTDKTNTLVHWAEAGPSTPPKRVAVQEENWDEDFRDSTDSPVQKRPDARLDEPENWDDDFEEAKTGDSPKASRSPRRGASWGSSDEEDDYGFAEREEDRTVTSRTRGLPIRIPGDLPPPPVPPIPSPFPRSDSASVFSVPASTFGGRDSVTGYSYSSGSHLPLRPTASSTSSHARLALLPPSPPIHRERRRLRKKSRPPPHLEANIYELDDRSEVPIIPQPSTPEQRSKPLGTSLDDLPLPEHAPPAHGSNGTKTPLLSRIGSVGKKWGTGRKKRASTGPSEVMVQEQAEHNLDRPLTSSPPSSAKGGWFFRNGGGGPGPGSPPAQSALRHENSIDRMLGGALDPDSPSRRGKTWAHSVAANGEDLSSAALVFGTPRRPMSMQVSESHLGSRSSSRPPVPRHASYGHHSSQRPATASGSSRSSSKQRSASASVEDVHRQNRSTGYDGSAEGSDDRRHEISLEEKSKSGGRSFMGGMRRISLVGNGKHKRTKSSIPQDSNGKRPTTASGIHDEDTTDQTTPRPPSRIIRRSGDQLLPPIELQPPSPPRLGKRLASRPSVSTLSQELSVTPQPRQPTLDMFNTQPIAMPNGRHALEKQTSASSLAYSPPSSPLPSPTRIKASTSPQQSASLGRATQPPPKELDASSGLPVPRRNSLGDLKIPTRISQAQVGLRRDLGMVREFATSVEQLKHLQSTYIELVNTIRVFIDESQPPSRTVSPTLYSAPKRTTRARSNTNPLPPPPQQNQREIISAFQTLEMKYRLSWECADLLVDLGSGASGASPAVASHPTLSASAAATGLLPADGRKSRERAITLAGDESKPVIAGPSNTAGQGSPSQWRASTGRNDLNQRQLSLLRDMLHNPESTASMAFQPHIPEDDPVNRDWRWGDAMNSTVTLPSEESAHESITSPKKKRRASRMGMRGLRDMLRSLKKAYSEDPYRYTTPAPASTTSVTASTTSSLNVARHELPSPEPVVRRRRGKSSTGPESMRSARESHANSPYVTSASLQHRSSPRRPSLASIFRIGQRNRSANAHTDHPPPKATSKASCSSGSAHASVADFEDWDQVDPASDLGQAAKTLGLSSEGTSTIRVKKGRSPYLLQRPAHSNSHVPASKGGPTISQSSLSHADSLVPPTDPSHHASSYSRSTKLSNVLELVEKGSATTRPSSRGKNRASSPASSLRRPLSSSRMAPPANSVRSAPPSRLSPNALAAETFADPKLAMTPENIGPLLENAREVHTRCSECIAELRSLLAAVSPT